MDQQRSLAQFSHLLADQNSPPPPMRRMSGLALLPAAFERSVVEAFELLEHEWRAFPLGHQQREDELIDGRCE
jgi:hypothetical protein